MARPREWTNIPASSLDRVTYGRIVRAVKHRSGALLLHRKYVSRNARIYHTAGQWMVVIDRVVIRSRSYYNGRPVLQPPTRWATRMLRAHAAGAFDPTADRDPGGVAEAPSSYCKRRIRSLPELGYAQLFSEARTGRSAINPEPDRFDRSGFVPACAESGTKAAVRRLIPKLDFGPVGYDELPRSLFPLARPITSAGLLRRSRRR